MKKRNKTIPSLFKDKVISYDFYSTEQNSHYGIVLFIPGFKGFKDWGTWDLVGDNFTAAGFDFVKCNLSHNGININKNKNEITDLIAFANNNFSIEIDDINRMVKECEKLISGKTPKIYLIGHSRGGALSILAASHNPRIDAIISWASPSNFGDHFFSKHLKKWEEEGVHYIKNNRTGQDLPLRYQLYQDYIINYHQLHIPIRVQKITQPFLAIHGDLDKTVSINSLSVFKKNSPHIQTHIIKGAGHTFGAHHPWLESDIPSQLKEVVSHSIIFLKQI